MIRHILRWNKWRKGCLNGPFHKLLVLLGLRFSPTYHLTLLPDEESMAIKGIKAGLGQKYE